MITTDILFDKIINITLYGTRPEIDMEGNIIGEVMDPTVMRIIKCPIGGLKPDIRVTMSMLPGSLVMNTVLNIRNYMPETNLSKFKIMEIEVGYVNGLGVTNTRKWICPIFSAYPEQPNPNGVTTFTGVTSGWVLSSISNRRVNIVINQDSVPLKDLIEKVCLGVGMKAPYVDLEPSLLSYKVTFNKTTVSFDNGLAAISWLTSKVVDINRNNNIQTAWGKIVAFVVDDIFYAFQLNYTKRKPTEIFVNLDKVTLVTFSGTVLNVVAPYHPKLTPGMLFKMGARYFRGRMSPSSVIENAKDKDNLYRVIQMDVSFDTVNNTNQMKITAINASSYDASPDEIQMRATVDKTINQQMQELGDANTIRFGNDDKQAITIGEPAPVKNVWDELGKHTTSNGVSHKVIAGDTISKLAYDAYASLGNLKKTAKQGNINPDYKGLIVTPALLWPMIALGTYNKYVEGDKQYQDVRNNPEMIQIGSYVFIPSLSSWDDVKQFTSFFTEITDTWEKKGPVTGDALTHEARIKEMRGLVYFLEECDP